MSEGLAGEKYRKITAVGSSYRNCHISQAVLREAVCQMSNQGADTPLSRAGSLPQWIGVELEIRFDSEPCGSGLAREGGVSVDINMSDPPLSRASPLPQWIGVELDIRLYTKTCGSEPARDGVGSACIKTTRYPLAPRAAISSVSK